MTGRIRGFLLLLPLIATQLLQRAEHYLDNRLLGFIGEPALLIHNVQFLYFSAGQFIGTALGSAALIFWKDVQYKGKARYTLGSFLFLALTIGTGAGLFGFTLRDFLIGHFQIAQHADLIPPATQYLAFGSLNLVLQAVYGTLNLMLIALDLRVRSTALISVVLVAKALGGSLIVSYSSQLGLESSLFWFGALNVASVGGASLLALAWILKRTGRPKIGGPITQTSVWLSELGLGFAQVAVPMIYALLLARAEASGSFYLTYQLALQLAYIFCLPISAGMQVALRDASAGQAWIPPFIQNALIPTQILLLVGALFSAQAFTLLYGYTVPTDHRTFLPLFYVGCMIGQAGNVYMIALRAAKRNALALKLRAFIDFTFHLGLVQLLVLLHAATPLALGFGTIVFASAHTLFFYFFAIKTRSAHEAF